MTVDLTLTKVRRIIAENTKILTQSATLLGAGLDFRSYLINDHWVFRFPNTPNEADALFNERQLLNSLSLPTRTPVFEYWLDRPFGYTMPIAGYRLIRGESMESVDSDSCDNTHLAKDLGRILRTLHKPGIDPGRRSSSPNGHPILEISSAPNFDSVGLTTSETSSLAQFVSRYSQDHSQFLNTRIHGDLGVEHIITRSGRHVEGVIDWSNATFGNPFRDFIGLWGWGGDNFVTRVLSNYDNYPHAHDWGFIRVGGLLYCLHRLRLAAAYDLEYLSILQNRLRQRINETRGMNPSDPP